MTAVSRALTARYTLTGELVAVSPLHIGAAATGATIDLEHVRDGLDRLVIPGTSLAGVLRTVLSSEDRRDGWWGTHLTGHAEKDTAAHASRITIADAASTADARVVRRDGVSIDRITAAAAHRHLFTREVVTTGTRFTFSAWLEVAESGDDAAAAALMARLGARLTAGITAGAAGNAGLGRLRLEQPVLRREDFTTPAGLFDALTTGGSVLEIDQPAPAAGRLRVTIPWRPLGAVMSKVASASGEAAAWPALDSDATGTSLVLLIPGTSIKGILRAHAERIVRTLTGTAAVDTVDPLVQLAAAASLPGIGELFGAAGDLAAGETGRKGLLSVGEVTSTVEVPADLWQRVRAASAQAVTRGDRDRRRTEFADAVDALNAVTGPQGLWFDIAARTAIDRWTGAASDGLLFTALEPHTVAGADVWSPIHLDIDLTRIPPDAPVPVEALVTLVLLLARDLAEGWIPLGYATTRGLGAVRAETSAITVTLDTGPDHHVGAALRALDGHTLHDILTSPELADRLEDAWRAAIFIGVRQS
ncbi:RAMP superfamily CRISPR-associated protein [Nocardia abscessus]|uniref:RAMP superfamily CRISPR-associated protein n=1 Tax=Nocardia abscessus TaxID=120957 RepID=UPI002454AF1C|nr:RAMP superfamily CRISPR-associated protein [Nocardia abscessus]